jgi:hypothetical protein
VVQICPTMASTAASSTPNLYGPAPSRVSTEGKGGPASDDMVVFRSRRGLMQSGCEVR